MTSPTIKAHARALGFDACGIAPAADHPELRFFREWLDRGYAGDDGVPASRSAERRADVRQRPALGAHRHRHRHRLQHRPSVFDRVRRSRSRADRALRVGRRLSRRASARGSSRCSPGCASSRRSRSTRAPTSTPARCRSASTRSTPASAGSARTPASSTPSSGRGCSSARSSAACRSRSTRRRSISAARARCASRRVRRRRSSRPACSTRRAAFRI